MKKLLCITIASLLVGLSTMRAQQAGFHTKLLAEMGKSIGYVPDHSLPEGAHNAGSYKGLPVVAKYDKRHNVTNLGIRIFSPKMKEAYASDVYDFLERYFLELLTWNKTTIKQKMDDDKVMFVNGSPSTLSKINENTPYSINKVEHKYYEVSWKNESGKAILTIAFPINYELILGMPQNEIANTMYDRIVGSPKYTGTVSTDSLEYLEKSIYRTFPVSWYQLKDVNNALYFNKSRNEYRLLTDAAYVNYSATNALQQPTKCNNPVSVEQSVYGFKTLNYTVTLSQLINYFHSADLKTYAAIEEEYDDAVKVLIVAESKDLGYNHILNIIVPRNFITKPNAELKCKMSAFIPTHNVKNLYQQYVNKPKKKF